MSVWVEPRNTALLGTLTRPRVHPFCGFSGWRRMMALATKDTRRIVVDDSAYRWTVSSDDESGIAIACELEQQTEQRVVAWFDYGPVLELTPGVVRRVIARPSKGMDAINYWSRVDLSLTQKLVAP